MLTMLACSDCNALCVIKFCLLTTDDRIVYMTTCARCNDHKTLRYFATLDHDVWMGAAKTMPVVAFQRAA